MESGGGIIFQMQSLFSCRFTGQSTIAVFVLRGVCKLAVKKVHTAIVLIATELAIKKLHITENTVLVRCGSQLFFGKTSILPEVHVAHRTYRERYNTWQTKHRGKPFWGADFR